MKKLALLVACHKPGKVYLDDVHVPFHVGRAISKFKDEMSDMTEDVTIILIILKRLYPDYEQDALQYLHGFKHHYKNMFVSRKELFDDYATWLFSILTACEKYVRQSPYTRGKRVFAYLGEFLMPVYFMHHHYRIYTTRPVGSYGRKHEGSFKSGAYQVIARIHAILAKRFVLRPQTIDQYISQDVKTGLSMDGIEIKIN